MATYYDNKSVRFPVNYTRVRNLLPLLWCVTYFFLDEIIFGLIKIHNNSKEEAVDCLKYRWLFDNKLLWICQSFVHHIRQTLRIQDIVPSVLDTEPIRASFWWRLKEKVYFEAYCTKFLIVLSFIGQSQRIAKFLWWISEF